jgi:uncharacterized protein YkwD
MVPMSAPSAVAARRRCTSAARPARRLLAAAAALVGIAASLLSAAEPSSASALPPRTTAEKSIAVAVQTVMNAERRAHGLPAVSMNFNLIVSARRHNLTMARYNTMSHQLPGEPYFARRITLAGYAWNYAGENIGWNSSMTQAGVIALQKIMYNEKAPNNGHRLNILNGHYRDVGIDVYFDKTHHKVWLTTDFGHKR